MKIVTDFRILAAPLAMVLLTALALAEDAVPVAVAAAQPTAMQRDRLDLDTTSVTGNHRPRCVSAADTLFRAVTCCR
jgi:D-aminopeptidase